MILILSRYNDPSTNHVVDWLKAYGENVFRINTSDDIRKYFESFIDVYLSENKEKLNNVTVKSVWFRRPPIPLFQKIHPSNNSSNEINHFFASEHSAVLDILYQTLKNKKWLNDNESSRPRKIDQLLIAKEVGLSIPNTIVTSSKEELVNFYQDNGNLILKAIQDPHVIIINKKAYTQYTALVTSDLINCVQENFYPCLFQQYIDKNLEIRTFYLSGKCFSMAICSSFDKQTRVDFRRYNDTKPNRKIPYQLPDEIEDKISMLMQKLNLNCGSIDLILDNYGKYYYLEVNPVGQFGMVSYPCNYYLEKEIADFLCKDL